MSNLTHEQAKELAKRFDDATLSDIHFIQLFEPDVAVHSILLWIPGLVRWTDFGQYTILYNQDWIDGNPKFYRVPTRHIPANHVFARFRWPPECEDEPPRDAESR